MTPQSAQDLWTNSGGTFYEWCGKAHVYKAKAGWWAFRVRGKETSGPFTTLVKAQQWAIKPQVDRLQQLDNRRRLRMSNICTVYRRTFSIRATAKALHHSRRTVKHDLKLAGAL